MNAEASNPEAESSKKVHTPVSRLKSQDEFLWPIDEPAPEWKHPVVAEMRELFQPVTFSAFEPVYLEGRHGSFSIQPMAGGSKDTFSPIITCHAYGGRLLPWERVLISVHERGTKNHTIQFLNEQGQVRVHDLPVPPNPNATLSEGFARFQLIIPILYSAEFDYTKTNKEQSLPVNSRGLGLTVKEHGIEASLHDRDLKESVMCIASFQPETGRAVVVSEDQFKEDVGAFSLLDREVGSSGTEPNLHHLIAWIMPPGS